MIKFSNIINLRITLICIVLTVVFLPKLEAAEIIVNQTVADEQLSLSRARAIFTMRQRFWSSGEQIKVYTLADRQPLHKTFAKKKLNMFSHQLRRVWDRMVFSGTGQAPIELDSETEMLQTIANTPNAIGYISREPEDKKVRVLIYE